MRVLATAALLLLAACESAAPMILTAEVFGGDDPTSIPIGFIRTNLAQTLVGGEVAFRAEAMTPTGIPVFAYSVDAGKLLWMDKANDVSQTLEFGSAIPEGAKILFPRTGEFERYGLTFDSPEDAD